MNVNKLLTTTVVDMFFIVSAFHDMYKKNGYETVCPSSVNTEA